MTDAADKTALPPFTRAEMTRCLEALRTDFGRAEVVSGQKNRVIVRWNCTERGISVIVKLWSHPEPTGSVRRLFRMTPCDWEWRSLARLHKAQVPVPRPLGRCWVAPSIASYTEALFLEDLGPCELATEHLKQLIWAGAEEQALRFEDVLIEMMERLLDLGIIDVDHGLANVVVQGSGRPVRLDLELARPVIWPRLPLFAGMYGEMLGRVIGLHAFAVQPDVTRSTRFATRVRERLQPSRRVLQWAGSYAHKMMQKQLEDTGIDTRLQLPWDSQEP